MAFSEPWDEAFPPDTQLANQLGQDIRSFKTDIRERVMSFAAGLLANRPTPDAIFGSVGLGVAYYAYDVGTLYYWTGVAWVAILCSGSFSDFTVTDFPVGPLAVCNTVVIPGGVIDIGTRLDILANFVPTDGACDAQLFLEIGGNTIFEVDPTAGTAQVDIEASILFRTNDATADYDGPARGTSFALGQLAAKHIIDEIDASGAVIIKTTVLMNAGNGRCLGLQVRATR